MTDPLNLAGMKLGNYRLRRLLGRGSTGVVYLAEDEALLRPTAVKVLTWSPATHDPEAWFLAEARSVAKLNHPSVIQIYSVARHGPHCYIAMEYVDGVSAEAMVTRDGPLSAERATAVILQLAAALELAHASGIIHRDVKPANILINKRDGTAKLGDFGMAVSGLRGAQTVRAGTPHYFAPEIWRGEPASIATDLYALGATYFYLLTGRPPIDDATLAGLSAAHQQQEVVAPPELAAGAAAPCMRVVRRCMAKSPIERYESALAAAWEMRGVLRELESPWLTPVDNAQPSLVEADAVWRARGFLFDPFAAVDPSTPPYREAPFDGLRRELGARFAMSGTALILAGAPGSGRSVLARWVFASHAGRGAYLDLERIGARPGSLAGRIARAFGAIASAVTAGNAELEGLLEVLGRASRAEAVPLIVIDGVVAGTRAAAEVATLVRAARSTRYFSLLVVGPAEFATDVFGAHPASAVIEMPPLTPRQVGKYVESWLRATRSPSAPPLIITIDAALIVGHGASGNLEKINTLARAMIAAGGPVLTSWDAWAALDDRGRSIDRGEGAPRVPGPRESPGDDRGRSIDRGEGAPRVPGPREPPPPVRPPVWPTPEVLGLINQYRIAAGLAERGAAVSPRAAATTNPA